MATLADLRSAADTASTQLAAAQSRLEKARADVVIASAAQHQAIVDSVSGQPAPPSAAPAVKARAASVTVDPVATAAKRLADALAAYDTIRRELGIT
jgi:hypothetical protein